MSTSRKLGLLLIVIILIALLGSAADWIGRLDLSEGLSQFLEQRTRIETVQKITEEQSATIDVVKNASPAVVSVIEKSIIFDLFTGPRLAENSIGTGFAVEKDIIVTNKHVVADTSAQYTVVAEISKDNQAGKKYTVTQIYRDPLNDVAILKINLPVADAGLPALTLGDSDKIQVGQTVIAIGNALGRFTNTVTQGIVSGIGRGITAQSGLFGQTEILEDVIQTDAALNPGNSGGPLLNLSGEVIGVNVAISQGTENIGFAIPVNRVKDVIESFKQNKKISRPFLGIEYQIVTKDIADLRGLVEGAFVVSVVSGSAADEAGLQKNDILTKIDSKNINEGNPLSKEILKHKVGDKVTLTIWRNGKTLEVTATLKEALEE